MSKGASRGEKVDVSGSDAKVGDVPARMFGQPSKDCLGLVVLQEWWGMNDQILGVAEDLAKRGNFVTIVPDLYRGKMATDHEEAGHLMSDLDWPGAVRDIRDCATHLKKKMGCAKVGVTGFCMGGALTLAAAVLVPEVDAAAPFYGIPNDDLADVGKIKIPLELHFGDKDAVAGFSDVPSQEKLKKKLDAGKVKYKFHSYTNGGHGFVNDTGPNYNKDHCETSLGRIIEFFRKM